MLTRQQITDIRERVVRAFSFSLVYGIIVWFAGLKASDGILKNIVWLFMSIGFFFGMTTVVLFVYLVIKKVKGDL